MRIAILGLLVLALTGCGAEAETSFEEFRDEGMREQIEEQKAEQARYRMCEDLKVEFEEGSVRPEDIPEFCHELYREQLNVRVDFCNKAIKELDVKDVPEFCVDLVKELHS